MAVNNISAGELNRTIILRVPTTVVNTEGGKERTFVDGESVRAKIERTNQVRAIDTSSGLLNTDVVIIRYRSSRVVTDEWLLKYDGVDHTIHSVEVLGANEFIRMTAKVKNG